MAARRLASQLRPAAAAARRGVSSGAAGGGGSATGRRLVARPGGVVVAVGAAGTALAVATPDQAQCASGESACCVMALGALQMGLAARWTLDTAAMWRDLGLSPPEPEPEPEPEPKPDPAAEFSEHVDEKSGRAYYCNVATREVLWDLPPGATVQPPSAASLGDEPQETSEKIEADQAWEDTLKEQEPKATKAGGDKETSEGSVATTATPAAPAGAAAEPIAAAADADAAAVAAAAAAVAAASGKD
eukprot:COSAG06_NODE_7374_length_2525_cov_1.829349_2_plen_246_part_00